MRPILTLKCRTRIPDAGLARERRIAPGADLAAPFDGAIEFLAIESGPIGIDFASGRQDLPLAQRQSVRAEETVLSRADPSSGSRRRD
jgi:hypothetical protein